MNWLGRVVLQMLVAGAIVPAASAFEAVTRNVSYPVGALTENAFLNLPREPAEKLPAVVLIHGSAGIDGRGAFHAANLNKAGIATLEIDMWGARGLKGGPNGRPRTLSETLPDAYAALKFLAEHPQIDPQRIGIAGFSWGSNLALMTAFEQYKSRGNGYAYAAHVAFYPGCHLYVDGLAPANGYAFGTPMKNPILVAIGSRDDYTTADDCRALGEQFNRKTPGTTKIVVYDGATHGWDGRTSSTFFDAAGNRNKGSNIIVTVDPRLRDLSSAEMTAFFKAALGVQ